MTYKAIVKSLISEEAERFVERALEKNEIAYSFTFIVETTMENDKEKDTIFWETEIEIILEDRKIAVVAGGTADDLTGICASCIWSAGKKKLLWMASRSTREQLGISEFKIA